MMQDSLNALYEWFAQYKLNLLLTIIAVGTYFILRRIVIPKLEAYAERDELRAHTLKSAIFTFSLFSAIVTFVVVLLIWGVDFRGLLALSTGIIAVTGVALFANWSILSNITAFFILLTHQSYRRGNYIRIIELDNYLEGYISDINLFNTILVTENKETIVYPNNLLTARATIINPRDRHSTFGKIEDLKLPARNPSEQLDTD